jgi:serine/threonine-protein kinase
MLIDVGQVVANKYELVRLLGRGSTGEVWSAHHQTLREQVALKVLKWPPTGDDAEEASVALARFRFEAQVAARLSRKTRHIARVTDYGEEDGLPYLIMELLDGDALDAALRQRARVSPAEAAAIVSQIARALGQAHAESVAHRDLKPANVFLTRDEEGYLLVKLLDFGIARTIHGHRASGPFSTAKGLVFGTPGYMSPEQGRASPTLDHRCDLWALATIAYEMLTGHLPIDGSDADELMKNLCAGRIVPLQERDPTLPGALGAFFDRAFAERIDERFESAAALARAFERACETADSNALLPSSPSMADAASTDTEFSADIEREARRLHRSTRAIAVASGSILLLAIAVVGGLWRGFAPPPAPRSVSPSLKAPTAAMLPAPAVSAVSADWTASPRRASRADAPVASTPSALPPSGPVASPLVAMTADGSTLPALRSGVPSTIASPARAKAPADAASPRLSHNVHDDRDDVF